MKSKINYFLGFGLAMMLLFIILSYQPIPAAAPIKNDSSNELVVSMLYQGDWRPVGALAFDKTPSEGILDFSGFSPKERWVFLRIQHSGASMLVEKPHREARA